MTVLVAFRIFLMRSSVGSGGCRFRAGTQRNGRPGTEILALGAAQCAASNRPLPGAETALFLYHRYFLGENPAR